MKDGKSKKGEIIAKTASVQEVNRENIELYVEMFKLWARKSAEATIGLTRTLVEAEDQLTPGEFEIFCDEVGVKRGEPSYKKLHVIGKRVDRFLPVSESLPDSWTTIYMLASLKEEDFESIREAKLIKPTLKALEIREHLSSQAIKKRQVHERHRQPTEVTLILREVDRDKLPEIFKAIAKWVEDTGLRVAGDNGFLPKI
jgi:hypothetical protein